jgi:hypothetical protein
MITKTCKMWLWQEVGDPQPQSQLQEVNNPQYLNEIITIWRREEFTLNPKNQILSMTKIDVGLMGIYSNYHGHNNYKIEWWKDKSKFKSKHKTYKLRQTHKRL